MNMFYGLFLNLILVFFPILVYFVYYCYSELCMEKYYQTLFSVALFSSLYLCLKFGNVISNDFFIMFCSLPIVVAYLKKQSFAGIVMFVVNFPHELVLYPGYIMHLLFVSRFIKQANQ